MNVDYKYKPDKHKCPKSIKTIDEMHKEHIETFQKEHGSISDKKTELNSLENELEILENSLKNSPINLNVEKMKRKGFLKKEIKRLQTEINKIENFKGEMSYFGKTGDIIFDYYNLTNGNLYNVVTHDEKGNGGKLNEEQKKSNRIEVSEELRKFSISDKRVGNKKQTCKKSKRENMIPHKTIMNYLVGDDSSSDESDNVASRATLENEYMLLINKNYNSDKLKISLNKKCANCGNDMILLYSESIMCCMNPQCGEAELVTVEYETPSQKDSFNEKPKYPYKRIGHCTEKLNQFQSKGSTNVPSTIFKILEEEIDKHNMKKEDISMNFIEKMLKKHKLSNYYENIMYIYCQMTGVSPMTLSRSEIDLVLSMFSKVEDLYYTKYKPADRDNFLKYSFTLHKIFMTINKPEHAKYFKLLKSPWKMKQQEAIWKNVCEDVGWPYYPS